MTSNVLRNRITGRDEPILDPELPIIDAHHHFYDRPTVRYMLDDYLADVGAGHRVVASVYIETQAMARPDGPELLRPIGEVEFANGVAAMSASGQYGDCRVAAAIVGYANLAAGNAVGELLDLAVSTAPDRFRGVRQVTLESESDAPFRYFIMKHRPTPGVLTSANFQAGLQELGKRDLTFDTSIFHQQLDDLAEVADSAPNTTIVLNHMGYALGLDMTRTDRDAARHEWESGLRRLAQRPNVVCKVGGLGMPFWGFGFETHEESPGYRELAGAWAPYVETTIDAFGVDRCMMESNYPPDARSCGFVPLWNALKFITRQYTEQERAALFHGTAQRVYDIGLP